MIYFPLIRTRRLAVQLKELTIGQSVALAGMPLEQEQAQTTAFLRFCLENEQNGNNDPADWTVEERTLAVAQYISATKKDQPDFAVGGEGKYSDYLDGAKDIKDIKEKIYLGEVGEDKWQMQYITGRMAESIERLYGELKGLNGEPLSGRLHWLLGAMACRLVRVDEEVPDPKESEGAYDEFLLNRMKVLASFPESDFQALAALFYEGGKKQEHFFRIEYFSDGIAVRPKEGTDDDLPSARFPVHSCLSEFAKTMVE